MTFDLDLLAARQDLQVLLARWSGAIAQLMKGETIGQVEPTRLNGVGFDTGEALNLGPAALTVTVGLGPKVFTDAYGLSQQKPPLLRDLVHLPSDALKPQLTGGDLSLQACADDPQVAYHAIRAIWLGSPRTTGTAATRWSHHGLRACPLPARARRRRAICLASRTARATNIKEDADFDRFVWLNDGPAWQHGTAPIRSRARSRCNIENWDTDRVSDQNDVFGRHKISGAPLTGHDEFDPPDFNSADAEGNLVIPSAAHIRLAAHENNDGIKILRRSYNYTAGINEVGLLDAGLLFISYQNNPAHFETCCRLSSAQPMR